MHLRAGKRRAGRCFGTRAAPTAALSSGIKAACARLTEHVRRKLQHLPARVRTGADVRILLIEDDSMIGRSVQLGLGDAGFSVDWVRDGDAAERALATAQHDLAVLDLGLPGRDGMAVLAALRRSGNRLPVLIASARDAVGDRIAGLNAGADDYVLKPFDLDELIARIRAVLRRHAGGAAASLCSGDIEL